MEDKIKIYDPKTGRKGIIDKSHLKIAMEKGYLPVDRSLMPKPGEKWGALVTDAAEKAALNTLDLPQNMAWLAEGASNLVGSGAKAIGVGGWHSDAIPDKGIASSKAKELLKNAGYSLEDYKPKTTTGKVVHGVLEGAGEAVGGLGIGSGLKGVAKIAQRLKLAKTGNTLNKTSSIFGGPMSKAELSTQGGIGGGVGGGAATLENIGLDRGSSGITAGISVPLAVLAGKGIKNSLSSAKHEKAVHTRLKKDIGNIEPKTPSKILDGYKPTTAELYNNASLSRIQQAMVNNPVLDQRHAQNNKAILNKINSLGDVVNDKYDLAEKIRSPHSSKYKESLKNRSAQTKDLYDKLEADTSTAKYPVISKALENKMEQLGPDYRKGLEKYHRDIVDQDFIPVKLENTIKEMDDKINAAMRSGNRSEAKLYKEIKDVYVGELEKNSPVGLTHRQKYRELSSEPNKYEKNSLLHNLVQENSDINKASGYVVPNETLLKKITSANVDDTKALVDASKHDPHLRELIKGAYIKKMLDSSTLNSVDALGNPQLSYHQMTKFVKDNRDKMSRFLNKEEKSDIRQIMQATKMKHKASLQGKGIGSDTYQKFKVGEEKDLADKIFSHYVPHAIGAGIGGTLGGLLAGVPGVSIGATVGGAGIGSFSNKLKKAGDAKRSSIFERAMVEPEYFNAIMSKKYPVNNWRPIMPFNIGINREES